MLAIGFLLAILLAIREGKRRGLSPDEISNVSFWILVSSILGSRLFHCVVFWRDFIHEPWRILFVWEGGLVFYGGFIAAVITSIVFCRIKKIPFFELADIIAPGIALGLGFGRLGCLLVGCCYGKTCPPDYPLAITFPPETVGMANVPLYPTQIFESVGCFIIFLILWQAVLRYRKFSGQVLALLLVLYGLLRTVLEFWRDDPRGFVSLLHFSAQPHLTPEKAVGIMAQLLRLDAVAESSTAGIYIFRLSESQVISLLMLPVALGIWLAMRKTPPLPFVPPEKKEIREVKKKKQSGRKKSK